MVWTFCSVVKNQAVAGLLGYQNQVMTERTSDIPPVMIMKNFHGLVLALLYSKPYETRPVNMGEPMQEV
jgi:hypothetical protein